MKHLTSPKAKIASVNKCAEVVWSGIGSHHDHTCTTRYGDL